ncbi:hypothetical protein C2845_PM13G12270 [Panicum miliaceum]|uniref:DUF4283 domain-containing protein n=1 Tax=Panicum miliaceum TaxID=4540 RepID=A0A3L6RIH5_PANMI|nr:hypothetical protein C2845_PM13G12270 [Panicum miliaceum]
MVPPVSNRGWARRDGFGAGRTGRGEGRTGGRANVWQRMDWGRSPEAEEAPNRRDQGSRGGDHHRDRRSGADDEKRNELPNNERSSGAEASNWDRDNKKHTTGESAFNSQDSKSKWDHREEMNEGRNSEKVDEVDQKRQAGDRQQNVGPEMKDRNMQNQGDGNRMDVNRKGCEICGLKNHSMDECRIRMHCELCGYSNYDTYECKREPLWNLGPELCAAQVPDQSFFFIDEHIDTRAAREKSSTAIITIISGELTSKQIELEFRDVVGKEFWKWVARKVSHNKFTMRFPNAKMLLDFSRFNLVIRSVGAEIKIEPCSSALGAKGKLQEAWFKVGGIPVDQRSVRTLAKVGGLCWKDNCN